MNIVNFNDVGARLRELRKDKGKNFTQAKMSEKLGVSLKHYGEVERGEKGLSVELAIKIKSELGVSLDFIFLGELPNMENPEAIGIIKKLNSVPIKKRKKVNELVNGFIDLILQSD